VYKVVETYYKWVLENDIPKLFFWGEPGRIVTEEKAKWYIKRLKNVKGMSIGQGLHYLQEDQPHKIGTEILAWLPSLNF